MLVRAAICTLLLVSANSALGAAPQVHLEIVLEDRLRIGEPQRWLQMLQDLPFASVRMRQMRAGEKPEIDRKSKTTGPIHVRGVLGVNGFLRVPDNRFRFADRRRIQQWAEQLKAGDVEPPVAFGLTANELVSVRQKLSARVIRKTRDQSLSQVIQDIRSNLSIAVTIDPSAATRIRATEAVDDELSGMSSGTALAAALRPRGLALVPTRTAIGSLSLRITQGGNVPEAWPVGWQPETADRDTIPKLFDFLQVEVAATPLDEALAALQGRLDVPFLLDHNTLAAREIDPARKRVRFPAKRTFYKRVLDQLLFQARLEAKLRTDDAGQPFIWITAIGLPGGER